MARPSLSQIERKWEIYKEAAGSVLLARAMAVHSDKLFAVTEKADQAYRDYRDLLHGVTCVIPLAKYH